MAERVVLASGSPRRRQLLASIGVPFDCVVPDVDESHRAGESPTDYVARLALAKARAVAAPAHPMPARVMVIAADTTVELDGDVIGKPTDVADARRTLTRLSGRSHHVHTGVAVALGDRVEHDVVTTAVTFVALSAADLDWYLATGEAMDKAGAYGLQGAAGRFVARVDGSVSNVVGLPLAELAALAARVGRPLTG